MDRVIHTIMRAVIAAKLVKRLVPMVNKMIRLTRFSHLDPDSPTIDRRSIHVSVIDNIESLDALRMFTRRPRVNNWSRSARVSICNLFRFYLNVHVFVDIEVNVRSS